MRSRLGERNFSSFHEHGALRCTAILVRILTRISLRNFLGEKIVRPVTLRNGVTVEASKGVKDQIEVSGNSLEDVSQSAADIQQICRVRNKDIRKFLDGIYVSERGNIVED
jgi:large subunit ribosomal protein L9e